MRNNPDSTGKDGILSKFLLAIRRETVYMENAHSRGHSRGQSPARRIRQACINCRRKKSKCPGEKPQCSTCRRLEQSCTYETTDGPARKRRRSNGDTPGNLKQDEVSRRFGSIEEKLSQLAASVQKVAPASMNSTVSADIGQNILYQSHEILPQTVHNAPQQRSMPPPASHPSTVVPQSDQGENLPPDVIEDGVKTYFSCFHAQPYTLLCQSSIGAGHSIHPVVLNPMLALAIRCSSHSYWKDPLLVRKWIHNLTEKSWQELLLMYGEGNTSLKYLQGLCLLAQVDFSDGRVHRAHTQLSLGIRIAQFSGYLTEPGPEDPERDEEVVRCAWTLFMLDRTYSITRLVSPTLTHHHFKLRKPISGKGLSLRASRHNTGANEAADSVLPIEQDLASLLVGIYSIWDDAIRYVFQTTSKSTTPPWQPGSELATIEYRFVDFEPEFSTHRYRLVGFPRRAIHEPHLRPYYATWLCFQLTYMSIQCCVHHPFIMFIKLQHVIRNVPPSFLQKSYKSSLIHSRWIIRFLDEMDEAGMMLYDPFIGYLAAIAATCQLEHTLSKHPDIAAAARLSFRSATKFLKKLSKYWNNIRELLGIVEELAARLSHRHTLYYSQDDYDGILPAVETERVGLAEDDMSLMWKLFDFASMSASSRLHPDQVLSAVNGAGNEGPTSRSQADDIPGSRARLRSSSGIASGGSPTMARSFTDTQNLSVVPDENLDSLNLSLFDQLPEDWVFTIDDWTLFGAPGSTYFYNEGA